MAGITEAAGLDLGLPQGIKDGALAYLVVALEARREEQLEADTAEVAELVTELGALDVYVLPPAAANQLIEARERAATLEGRLATLQEQNAALLARLGPAGPAGGGGRGPGKK